jgi:hypothetical protein
MRSGSRAVGAAYLVVGGFTLLQARGGDAGLLSSPRATEFGGGAGLWLMSGGVLLALAGALLLRFGAQRPDWGRAGAFAGFAAGAAILVGCAISLRAEVLWQRSAAISFPIMYGRPALVGLLTSAAMAWAGLTLALDRRLSAADGARETPPPG